MTNEYKIVLWIGGLVLSITIGIFLLFGSWFTVDTGEKAIQLRNGAIVRTVDAGLYFKIPFIDSTEKISTRTNTIRFEGLSTYSKDQQPAKVNVSVTYRIPIDKVEDVYTNFRSIEGLADKSIGRQVPNQVENTFGQYSAIEAVQKRVQFTKDINDSVKASLINYPIYIESVQLEDVTFSDAYEKSVEDRMRAEVEVQTQKQNLEKERISATILVTQAQAQADSTLAQAKADANAVILKGNAQAKAIRAKTEALNSGNSQYVELIKAETWNGVLPTTVLPSSSVPIINAK